MVSKQLISVKTSTRTQRSSWQVYRSISIQDFNQSAVMLKLEHTVCVKSCISPECWSASEYAWSLPVQAITPAKQHILSISPPQNLSAFHCFHHAERSHGQPAVGLNQRWHRSASPGVGKHYSASSIHDASLGPRTVPNCPAPIIRMFVYLHETWLNAY